VRFVKSSGLTAPGGRGSESNAQVGNLPHSRHINDLWKTEDRAMSDEDYSGRGLRVALIAGLGGIALIFLFATIDAVRLLGAMRAENKVLRQEALERTNHLASIRSSVLLCNTYLGDCFLDSHRQKASGYLAKVQSARSLSSSELATYRPATVDEQNLLTHLSDALDQHWKRLNNALTLMSSGKQITDEMLPLQTSFIEVTTEIEGIDGKQTAWTEARIESQFERLGSQLNGALGLGLAAAVLLAAGCSLYILRIERQNNRRYQEVLKARMALEQLSARLRDAQETERRTISRELHDQVGQTLNAVLVEAANLAKRIPPDDSLSLRYLGNIRTFADSSVNSIRDIALLLRPSMLDDLGLIPALEWQAREVSRRSGIKITVSAGNVPDALPDEMRTCVYRVVQEALVNVSRHSGAKCAVVTVREEQGSLFLSIEDDGSGFDTEKTRGLGMLGMEERVRQLGGQLEIRSTPGKGTEVRARLLLPLRTTTE
jgi:signal transduction histidine kinase